MWPELGSICAILTVAAASPLIQDLDENTDFTNIFQATADRKIPNFENFDEAFNDRPQPAVLREPGAPLFPDPDNYYENIKTRTECADPTFNSPVFQKSGGRNAAFSYSSPYDIPDTAFPVIKGSLGSPSTPFGGSSRSFDALEEYTYPKQLPVNAPENTRNPLSWADRMCTQTKGALDSEFSCDSGIPLSQSSNIDSSLAIPSQFPPSGMKTCLLNHLSSPPANNLRSESPDDFESAWAEACKRQSKQPNGFAANEPISILTGGLSSPKELRSKLSCGWEPVELAQVQKELRRLQNIR